MHPPQLLVRPDRRRARIGRLAAEVEDVGSGRRQLPAVGDGGCGVEEWPPSENESGVTLTTPMTSGGRR